MDGYDALIGQRGRTTVQSQSVCTVCVYTQLWAQHRHEQSRNFGMSVNVAWFPDYGNLMAGIFAYIFDVYSCIYVNILMISMNDLIASSKR